MRTVISLAVVPLFIPLQSITAQQAPPIEAGARIRVTAPAAEADRLVGTCLSTSGDSLRMQIEQQTSDLVIPLSSVTRLDVSQGRKSHALAGLGLGLLGGAAIGAVIGVDAANNNDLCADANAENCIKIFAAVFGFGGGLVGLFVGAQFESDRWEAVPLDQLRVSFVPQRDGRFALGLSVEF